MKARRSNGQFIRNAASDLPDRETCLIWWRAETGSPPPLYASVEFLRRVMAHEAQVKASGSHSTAVKNALKAALKAELKADQKAVPSRSASSANASRPTAATLKPGDILVREWEGRTYRVAVSADGFALEGRQFASLSAVANHITGSTWSGPRFFGLMSR